MQSALERAESKILPEPNSGCWLWDGAVDDRGYGRISVKGKWKHAHRFIYETYVGPVPVGLELDHKCRLPCCVNPDHLEPVTHRENVRRAGLAGVLGFKNKKKTNCPKGHPYSGENLYIAPNGWRQCMTCRKTTMHDLYLRRKKRAAS